MIKSRRVNKIPDELLREANEFYSTPYPEHYSKILNLSYDNRLFSRNDQPLLLVGVYTPSLFSAHAELWMIATRHLDARIIRWGRPMLREWIKSQPVEIIVRCSSSKAGRFLRAMGLKRNQIAGEIEQYEVV